MEINDIVTLIANVGFPVAMCFVMFYYMNKQSERHEQEISDLRDTINNNTQVLTELSTLIKTLVK
jgi:preprotein translocase subunit YajC